MFQGLDLPQEINICRVAIRMAGRRDDCRVGRHF
jgi:hypothetical protein